MKIFIFAGLVLLGSSAFGSDHWDYCASADGYYKMEEGEITLPSSNENVQYKAVKALKTIVIKQVTETCTLKNYKSKVTSIDDTISFEVWEIEEGTETRTAEFLCSRGGSGIPANDSCDDSTAKLKEEYKVK